MITNKAETRSACENWVGLMKDMIMGSKQNFNREVEGHNPSL